MWSSPVKEVLEQSPLVVPDSDSKDIVRTRLCFLLFWKPLLRPTQEVPTSLPHQKINKTNNLQVWSISYTDGMAVNGASLSSKSNHGSHSHLSKK